MNIVSQYQGVLNVPMYQAPYSVAPVGIGGINVSAAMNGYSDVPCVNSTYFWIRINTNPLTMTGGAVTALRYTGHNTITIGGGGSNGSDDGQRVFSFAYNNFSFNVGGVWSVQTGVQNYNNYVGLSRVPFYLDRSTPTLQAGQSRTDGNTSLWYQTTNGYSFNNYTTGQVVMPCVSNGPNSILPVPAYAQLVADQFGHGYLVAIVPGEMINFGPFAAPITSTGSLNGDFAVPMNFSNQALNLNWLFGLTTNATINFVKWNIPNIYSPNLYVIDKGTLSFDSNSNLNAQLAKYGANSVCRPIGLRGFMAVDTDSGKDYFVNIDGSKYYRVVYQPQGVAGLPLSNATEIAYKFIDINGVFWYTGQPTWAGGMIRPYFSLGYNLPFAPPPFPDNVSPIDIPCWNPCLNMDAPFNKVYEG